jgi:hypothetical protein
MKTKSKFNTLYLMVALALAGIGGQAQAQFDSASARGVIRANTVRPDVSSAQPTGTLCGSGRGGNGVLDQVFNLCQGYDLRGTPPGWTNVDVGYQAGGGFTIPGTDTSAKVRQSKNTKAGALVGAGGTADYYVGPWRAGSFVISFVSQDRNFDPLYLPPNPPSFGVQEAGTIFYPAIGLAESRTAYGAGYNLDQVRASLSTASSNYTTGRAACPPGYSLNLIAAGPDGETYSCVKQ